MKRRDFLSVLGGAVVAWPFAARAQQQSAMRRLGFLSLGLPDDAFGKNNTAAFLQGLAALGWKEGVNVQIDWRWFGADAALAEHQAAELIALRPDMILAGGNPAVEKLRQQTRTIPVVFTLVSDPVGLGYADSLSHPGGNFTGFESYTPQVYTKELQMLTQITPPAATAAILYNPATAPYAGRMVQMMQDAAKAIGVTVRDAPCHDDAGIEAGSPRCPGKAAACWPWATSLLKCIARRSPLSPSNTKFRQLPIRAKLHRAARFCLCAGHSRLVSPGGNLCRSHFQGREARRPAGAGAEQLRAPDQSQDRKSAGSNRAPIAARHRRRDH